MDWIYSNWPICLIIFLVVSAVVYGYLLVRPLIHRKPISKEVRDRFRVEKYYGDADTPERAKLLFSNKETIAEYVRLIDHADHKIILATHCFDVDHVGKIILSALAVAAKKGVEIQLLIDGKSFYSNRIRWKYYGYLASFENVQMKAYSPFSLTRPWRFFPQMNENYLIVDEDTYIVGTRGICEEDMGWKPDRQQKINVLVYQSKEMEDSSLGYLQTYFSMRFELRCSKVYMKAQSTLMSNRMQQIAKELDLLYQDIGRRHADWFATQEYEYETVPTQRIRILVNPILPTNKSPVLFYRMTELMRQVKEKTQIWSLDCNPDLYMCNRLYQIGNYGKRPSFTTCAKVGKWKRRQIERTGIAFSCEPTEICFPGNTFLIGERLTGIGSFAWTPRETYVNTQLVAVIDSLPLADQLLEGMEG